VKNKFDPRHLKRIANVQALFAWECGNTLPKTEDTPQIIKTIPEIDKIIVQNAQNGPLINQQSRFECSPIRFLGTFLSQKKPRKSDYRRSY